MRVQIITHRGDFKWLFIYMAAFSLLAAWLVSAQVEDPLERIGVFYGIGFLLPAAVASAFLLIAGFKPVRAGAKILQFPES